MLFQSLLFVMLTNCADEPLKAQVPTVKNPSEDQDPPLEEDQLTNYVTVGVDGKIRYLADEKGNTIPDFSRVGYHHGNREIPSYPAVKTLTPLEGDNWKNIQDAIDEVSLRSKDHNGHRGTILLKKGTYNVSKSLVIQAGGIVLQGEGDGEDGTRLIATAREQHTLIDIKGKVGQFQEVLGTRTKITDSFVPVGTYSFNVAAPRNFQKGDRIIVYRPGTTKWIQDLKMDQIADPDGTTRQWTAEEYNFSFERVITKIEDNLIYIDNPIVMQIEEQYGGGEVYAYVFPERISEVGISDMYLGSVYAHDRDEEHAWNGVRLNRVENCWVQRVTAQYFGYAAVTCEKFAKNVTVTDCRCLDAKSIITGARRYSFNNSGQQNLFMNCETREGRHDYVTGVRVCGPNVFYNCIARKAHAITGPHQRWAMGTLYDNITTDWDMAIEDRGNSGTTHGWTGVTQVFWNCTARRAAVQKPWSSGDNYCIGMKGERHRGTFYQDRLDGIWESENENAVPQSLYKAQKEARKNQAIF